MLLEMQIQGLTLDPISNMPIVILKNPNREPSLPIWIGYAEANAIALELEKISSPRPMTHDLMRNIIDHLEAKVKRIVVTDLKDNTYHAEIELLKNGKNLTIDARPSDAIALALRTKAPIFVAEQVLQKSKKEEGAINWYDTGKMREWLENLTPDDFGSMEQ